MRYDESDETPPFQAIGPDDPSPGDLIHIYAKKTMRVRVTDVSYLSDRADTWKVTGVVVEGKGVGETDVWHLREGEYEVLSTA